MIDATLESIHDSIAATLPILREMAQNSSPEPYTLQNILFTKINIFISILAFVCGAIGAYYGWKGYKVSKMTAIGVERVYPNTQRVLIIEYLRHVMSAYMRLYVILSAYTKRSPSQIPSLSTVCAISLPTWREYYYEDRFQQFRDCVRSIDDSSGESMSHIREYSSRKAMIELKHIELATERFEKYLSVFTEDLKKYSQIDIHTNNLLLETLNNIILRNYTILSFIDPDRDSMTQYRCYWGRSAVLDLMCEVTKELSTMYIKESKLEDWYEISKEIVNDKNIFIYKLIHNEHFNINEYLHSSEWGKFGVKTEKDLTESMINLVTRLLCISSKYYMAKTEKS